jgi:hypothetical protein
VRQRLARFTIKERELVTLFFLRTKSSWIHEHLSLGSTERVLPQVIIKHVLLSDQLNEHQTSSKQDKIGHYII